MLAVRYYPLAVRQGEPEAEMGLSRWLLHGHKGAFDINEELAYEFAR